MEETAQGFETASLSPKHWFGKLTSAFIAWLKRDGVVILLFILTALLMSSPIVFKLGGGWLALRDGDTYVKIWDNWWLREHVFNGASLTFTDLLFYPKGLDLSYHSISWTVALLSVMLGIVTDNISAYNLTILIALFATAYAAYLLARPFMRCRAAAWLAGAIYSYAPYHLAHAGGHPDLVHLAPIPLAVLLLYYAFTRKSLAAALGAALMIGLAGFTSLYIMVFALLTIGPVFIFLLVDNRSWSDIQIRRIVLVFIVVSAALLAIRLWPIYQDTSALDEAIESKYTAEFNQTDLLSYFLPSYLNPVFAPYTSDITDSFGNMSAKWPAYLGVLPVALSISALFRKKQRKAVFLWLAIGLMFFVLSLGPTLRFNATLYEGIPLPARYLAWFPPIRAVGRPDFFVLGVLLPLAMLAAYGFDRLLEILEGRKTVRLVMMIAVPSLLLIEYWSGSFPGVSTKVNPFYSQLSQEPDEFGIIQLPMGRSESKYYQYLQTIHSKPIVEGLSARTSADAYEYIVSNPILLSWYLNEPLDCAHFGDNGFSAALDELIDVGFRYVLIRHEEGIIPERYDGYFPLEPSYHDADLTVFKLADLRERPPCQS